MSKSRLSQIFTLLCIILCITATAVLTACGKKNVCTVSLEYNEQEGQIMILDRNEDGRFPKGSEVQIAVIPKEGYEILSFTVNGAATELSEDGLCTLTVDQDLTLKAEFKATVDDTPAEVEIIWDVDEDACELTVVDPAEVYHVGDTLKFQIATKNGYFLKMVRAKATPLTAVDGIYSAVLEEDAVVISADFEHLTDELLGTLRGNVLFEGVEDCAESLDDYHATIGIFTQFDHTHGAIWQREYFEGECTANFLYYNQDGHITLVTHKADGKIELQSASSDDLYADYDNPFEDLAPADFTAEDEGIWRLAEEKADATATAITGYSESVANFLLYVAGGKIQKIAIEIHDRTIGSGDNAYVRSVSYEFTAASCEALPDDYFTDYVMTPEHNALKTALENAAQAKSYTVAYHSVEEDAPDPETAELDYFIYVTENAIYEGCAGYEQGYLQRDGGAYYFSYDPETEQVTLDDSISASTIAELRAPFTFTDLAYTMLESKGSGRFEARLIDLVVQTEMTDLAGALAVCFADGPDRVRQYIYATDFALELKDGALFRVSFHYAIYASGGALIYGEDVVLTYSDFDTTTIPVDLSKIEGEGGGQDSSLYPQKFWGTFRGTDEDDGTEYVAVITADSVSLTIGGAVQTIGSISYDDYEDFTLEIGGTEYYLMDASYQDPVTTLMLMDETSTLNVTLTRDAGTGEEGGGGGGQQTASYPQKYWGTFRGTPNADTTEYEVTITADSLSLSIRGAAQTIEKITYDELDEFLLIIGGKEYYLNDISYSQPDHTEGGPATALYLSDEDYTLGVTLKRVVTGEETEVYPEEYRGTFTGRYNNQEYVFTVGETSVTLTIDGVAQELTVEFDTVDGFTITFAGATYYVTRTDYDGPVQQLMLMKDDNKVYFYLNRQ